MYAPALGFSKDATVPADAPPMFVAAATDDELGLAPVSVFLYEKWIAAHKSAELHIYSKGGHGFAMRKEKLPVDHWIDRFTDWMELQGWLQKRLSRGPPDSWSSSSASYAPTAVTLTS